ncbi:MAG: hypothetical protein QM793_01340 [Muricomes sp.]
MAREYGPGKGRIKIKSKELEGGIKSYELVHPLPVALDEGICKTKEFMEIGDLDVYISFLKKKNRISYIFTHSWESIESF